MLPLVTFPTRSVSVADRYYFSSHKEQRRDLVIGPLVNTKQRDAQAFHLSRRIEADDGSFSGVKVSGEGVTAALLKQHGVQVFSELQLPGAASALAALSA